MEGWGCPRGYNPVNGKWVTCLLKGTHSWGCWAFHGFPPSLDESPPEKWVFSIKSLYLKVRQHEMLGLGPLNEHIPTTHNWHHLTSLLLRSDTRQRQATLKRKPVTRRRHKPKMTRWLPPGALLCPRLGQGIKTLPFMTNSEEDAINV